MLSIKANMCALGLHDSEAYHVYLHHIVCNHFMVSLFILSIPLLFHSSSDDSGKRQLQLTMRSPDNSRHSGVIQVWFYMSYGNPITYIQFQWFLQKSADNSGNDSRHSGKFTLVNLSPHLIYWLPDSSMTPTKSDPTPFTPGWFWQLTYLLWCWWLYTSAVSAF